MTINLISLLLDPSKIVHEHKSLSACAVEAHVPADDNTTRVNDVIATDKYDVIASTPSATSGMYAYALSFVYTYLF